MPPAAPAPAIDRVSETHWTSIKYLAISRLVIAGVLAALVPLSVADAGSVQAGVVTPQGVTLAYLALAVGLLASIDALRPRFHALLVVQTVLDLIVLTALMHATGGVRGGFGILLVAPVAGAAILSTPLAAGSFASMAALLLLGETAWRVLQGGAGGVDSVQAGLVGAACFAAAALTNRLARRSTLQEALARRRGQDLDEQMAVNRLVFDELPDGVVVMSPQGAPRTLNRSARQLLGQPPAAPGWQALSRAHDDWRAGGARSGQIAEVSLPTEAQVPAPGRAVVASAASRMRLRFLGTPRPDGDVVIVVEDLDRIEQRAQQLKLAAMGRLSASIAHEIRNPLGAIRHANGLLAERLDDARLRRLAAIVEDNSVRIDRVVEHVLSIARRERAEPEPLDAAGLLAAFVPEFAAQQDVPAERIAVRVESSAPIMFDAGHLRQVLINLVGNALRHASDAPGAVVVAWREAPGDRLELSVSDDGPGLAAEHVQHAFEPFFTTEARGTGLGLYLVRELCASNGASVRYERHAPGARHGGAFVIELAQPPRQSRSQPQTPQPPTGRTASTRP